MFVMSEYVMDIRLSQHFHVLFSFKSPLFAAKFIGVLPPLTNAFFGEALVQFKGKES